MWPCSDVSCKLDLVCTRVSTRARSTPWIGTIAGSIQINEGRPSPFSVSNFPITTCRNLGSMTVFSIAFISQDLVCEVVVSLFVLCLMFLSFSRATCWLDGGCVPLYPVERL